MQRTFIATIAFALALTSVLGAFQASSYVKPPVPVAQNNETNFTNTNTTSTLGLASITTGQVYLTATNYTSNKENISNFGWNVYAKKLEAKALTAASPLIYNFNSTNDVIYVNSYAIGFASETESAITNLKIYQVPLTTTGGAGAPLPKLTYTNNTNGTTGAFAPSYVTNIAIGKVVYVFYKSAEKTVSIASFTVGGTLSTTNTVLTTNYTDGSLQVVWGESLGTSKLLAVWNEGATLLKDATVDLTKTNVTANTVEGYTSSHTCYAYATDKTLYGEICTAKNDTDPEPKNRTITYSVRTTNNGSKLVNFTTFAYSGNPSYVANYAYGPYLIFDFANNTVSNATTNEYQYFYEIWNFDNSSLCRPRTLYLQINQTATTAQNFRVVSGGLYTLFYDKAANKDSTLTNVQVGLLLGSSNLASVLGFLLTIIAGLLLF